MSAYDSPQEFVNHGLAGDGLYQFWEGQRRELRVTGRKLRRRQITVETVAYALIAGERVTIIGGSEAEAAEIMEEARRFVLQLAARMGRRRFDFARFAEVLRARTRERLS